MHANINALGNELKPSSKRITRRSIIMGRFKWSSGRDRKRVRGIYKPHGSVYDLWAECLKLCMREDCAKWISGILAAVKRAGTFKINTLARYRPRVVLQSARESLAASARRVIEFRGSSRLRWSMRGRSETLLDSY